MPENPCQWVSCFIDTHPPEYYDLMFLVYIEDQNAIGQLKYLLSYADPDNKNGAKDSVKRVHSIFEILEKLRT